MRIGDELTFALRPMKRRRGDGVAALTALLQVHNPAVALRHVGAANLERLNTFPWPRDLDDLREAVPRLEALILARGNGRAAAERLGLHHSSLQKWLARVGLTFRTS